MNSNPNPGGYSDYNEFPDQQPVDQQTQDLNQEINSLLDCDYLSNPNTPQPSYNDPALQGILDMPAEYAYPSNSYHVDVPEYNSHPAVATDGTIAEEDLNRELEELDDMLDF